MLRSILLMLFLLLASGCGDRSPAAEADPESSLAAAPIDSVMLALLPPGASREQLESGRRHFLVCSVCHGLEAHGTALAPSLRDGRWIHISGSLEEIEQVILEGIRQPAESPIPMPPMGGGRFDAEELRSIAIYVEVLGRRGS